MRGTESPLGQIDSEEESDDDSDDARTAALAPICQLIHEDVVYSFYHDTAFVIHSTYLKNGCYKRLFNKSWEERNEKTGMFLKLDHETSQIFEDDVTISCEHSDSIVFHIL